MFYYLFLDLFIEGIIRHMQQDSAKENHRGNKNKEERDTKGTKYKKPQKRLNNRIMLC